MRAKPHLGGPEREYAGGEPCSLTTVAESCETVAPKFTVAERTFHAELAAGELAPSALAKRLIECGRG